MGAGGEDGCEEGWISDLMKHALHMHHDLSQAVQSIANDITSCFAARSSAETTGVLRRTRCLIFGQSHCWVVPKASAFKNYCEVVEL